MSNVYLKIVLQKLNLKQTKKNHPNVILFKLKYFITAQSVYVTFTPRIDRHIYIYKKKSKVRIIKM